MLREVKFESPHRMRVPELVEYIAIRRTTCLKCYARPEMHQEVCRFGFGTRNAFCDREIKSIGATLDAAPDRDASVGCV